MEPNPPNRSTEARRFDLNMKEDLLEAWAPSDGIRELIANALDEQVLTGTDAVAIEVNDSTAEIRDHGRGLRYEHFAQGEDEEKLSNPDRVIGKFGVGLKDALAASLLEGVELEIELLLAGRDAGVSKSHKREGVVSKVAGPDNIRYTYF